MPKPFAAFDVDGTIFKSSLAEKIIEHGIEDGLFPAEPFNDVYESRRRSHETNNDETYQAYINKLVGTFTMQIAGVEVERFDKVASSMIRKHEVRKFRLPRLIIQALEDSHLPIVVSGSPDVLVRPFVADLNITTVYGSTYATDDGRFTGEAYGVGDKAALLQKHVEAGDVIKQGSVAIGDTASDISMLDYADKPIMFNPSSMLMKHGEKEGWDKALEVKDSIVILSQTQSGDEYHQRDVEEFLDSLRE